MYVDHRINIWPQPKNFSTEVVPDTGDTLAPHNLARRDISNNDIIDFHFFKRNLGMLCVGQAMFKIWMGYTDNHIAQSIVNVSPC